MTSTLSSFVLSLIAGGTIVIAIGVALIWVSSNDQLSRS